MNLCKCGCKQEVKKEYAKGHYARVHNPTRDNPEIAKRAIANAHKVLHAALKDGSMKPANKGLTKFDNPNLANKTKGKKVEEFLSPEDALKYKLNAKNSIEKRIKKMKEEGTYDTEFNKHMKEYWKNEKHRLEQRERQVNWLTENDYNMKTSKAELLYEEILKKNNIKYIKQFRFENKLFDFKIDNTLVEIDGDFYHANPEKFVAKYPIQIKTIANDKIKNEIVANSEYTLKRIWYSDLIKFIKEKREAELLP